MEKKVKRDVKVTFRAEEDVYFRFKMFCIKERSGIEDMFNRFMEVCLDGHK